MAKQNPWYISYANPKESEVNMDKEAAREKTRDELLQERNYYFNEANRSGTENERLRGLFDRASRLIDRYSEYAGKLEADITKLYEENRSLRGENGRLIEQNRLQEERHRLQMEMVIAKEPAPTPEKKKSGYDYTIVPLNTASPESTWTRPEELEHVVGKHCEDCIRFEIDLKAKEKYCTLVLSTPTKLNPTPCCRFFPKEKPTLVKHEIPVICVYCKHYPGCDVMVADPPGPDGEDGRSCSHYEAMQRGQNADEPAEKPEPEQRRCGTCGYYPAQYDRTSIDGVCRAKDVHKSHVCLACDDYIPRICGTCAEYFAVYGKPIAVGICRDDDAGIVKFYDSTACDGYKVEKGGTIEEKPNPQRQTETPAQD